MNNTKKYDSNESQNAVSLSSKCNDNDETDLHFTESDNFNSMVNSKLQETKDKDRERKDQDDMEFLHVNNEQIDDKYFSKQQSDNNSLNNSPVNSIPHILSKKQSVNSYNSENNDSYNITSHEFDNINFIFKSDNRVNSYDR